MAKRHYGNQHDGMSKEMGKYEMRERSSGMIHDDLSAPCNLPQHVMEKYWPIAHEYNTGMTPTLFSGVQKQLAKDGMDMRKAYKPGKY